MNSAAPSVLTTALSERELDEIFSWQSLVAWAGEARAEPTRMRWWQTDITDPNGGGDFVRRLLPRTHAWAALRAAREAARRTEFKYLSRLGGTLRTRSLFWLGAEIDEAVEDRVDHFVLEDKRPEDVLPLPMALDRWDRARFEEVLRSAGAGSHKVVPDGREVSANAVTVAAVKSLVSALAPLIEPYPMPFFRVKA